MLFCFKNFRRRQLRDKIKQLQIRKVSVTPNNECSGVQTLPATATSDYSTIQDPYNYIHMPIEGSLNQPNKDHNYSKMHMEQQSASDIFNYNHIEVDEFGTGSDDAYSCTVNINVQE